MQFRKITNNTKCSDPIIIVDNTQSPNIKNTLEYLAAVAILDSMQFSMDKN
jgi:hypothetical protein